MEANDVRELLGEWLDHDQPVYQALAARLTDLIDEGTLPHGVRLPAERQLASVLAVSRGTVVRSYEWLRERDLVHTRHGSGTLVGDSATPAPSPQEAMIASLLPSDSIFAGVLGTQDQAIDLRGATWIGDPLPADVVAGSLERITELTYGHGYWPKGLPELREQIADLMTLRGLKTTADQILITTGAMQAISLIARLRLAPGDLAVAEDSSYPGALDALRMTGAHVVGVTMTDDGADVGEITAIVQRRRPRLVYLTPSFNNPTGTVMPHGARQLLLGALAGSDTVVIDDLTMSELWLDEAPPPPLAVGATPEVAARILTVGSLSKTLWGGLRVGWVRGPATTIARLSRMKIAADLSSSVIGQVIASDLLETYDTIWLPRRRAELRERHDLLVDALHEHLPEWRWRPPAGGLALWVDLGWGCSVDLGPYAARHGVGIAPGTVYSPNGRSRHRLRIPFGQRPELLNEAVRRLANAWDQYQNEVAPRDHGYAGAVI